MDNEENIFTADQIVDELLPGEFDWRAMVRSYPIPAIAIATVGGFLIGRRRGPALIAAISAFVVNEVTKNVDSLLRTDGSKSAG